MHRLVLLLVDLFLVAASTVAALMLRDNLEFSFERLQVLLPYLAVTLVAATPVLLVSGLNRALWRFSTLSDYLRVVVAVLATVLLAVALGFAFNRLENVSRALPVMQGILMTCALVAMRVLMRLRHARRSRTEAPSPIISGGEETVVVVGMTVLTELFLRAVEEFARNRINVAGILARSDRHRGRLLGGYEILGTPEQLEAVLKTLEVHGMLVNRIVITMPFEQLSAEAHDALLHIEKTSEIRLDFFAERVGLQDPDRVPREPKSPDGGEESGLAFVVDIDVLGRNPYLRAKRRLDAAAAVVLLIAFMPLILLIGLIAMLDVGYPPVFWQQRPGARGRPFRLYKFRTMAAAHNAAGHRIPDPQRHSAIGRFLRRFRLDELPQLWNILIGQMSFVGPRPLLPADQPTAFAARLLVRPGLTGLAQIKGGRALSASDKAALDVWYINNMSMRGDLRILAGTIRMILRGERADSATIHEAWQDLGYDRARGTPEKVGGARRRRGLAQTGEVGACATAAPRAGSLPGP